jgi:uncharacterized membrane protein YgcG
MPQLARRTLGDAHDLDDAAHVNMPGVNDALEAGTMGGEKLTEASLKRMLKDPNYRQVKAFAIPKGTLDELKPTTGQSPAWVRAGRIWNITKSKTSRAMFSLNAPWLAANIGSNVLTSAVAGITPWHAVKGEKWWKELSPEAQQFLAPMVDISSRLDNLYEPQLGAAGNKFTAKSQALWAQFHEIGLAGRTPLKSLTDSWMHLERRTANQPFRLAALYKMMNSDKRFVDLNKHMGEANGLMNKLIDVTKLPPEKQTEWLRANSKHIEHYGNLIDEALGDFTKFSKAERVANNTVMFYPWIRFSLRWAFKTLPSRHPILLNIASQLIKMNNEELTGIFGEEPPADMLGNMKLPEKFPVIGGRIIDTRKYVPTGNSLMELFNDQDTASALGLLPPAAAAAFTATSRRDARSRLNYVNVHGQRSDPYTGPENYGVGTAARVFANQMVGSSFAARELDRFRSRGRAGSDSLPFSERPINVTSPNAVRADKQRRKYQNERVTAKLMVMHYLGMDVQDPDVLRNAVQARNAPAKKKKKGGGSSSGSSGGGVSQGSGISQGGGVAQGGGVSQ